MYAMCVLVPVGDILMSLKMHYCQELNFGALECLVTADPSLQPLVGLSLTKELRLWNDKNLFSKWC